MEHNYLFWQQFIALETNQLSNGLANVRIEKTAIDSKILNSLLLAFLQFSSLG